MATEIEIGSTFRGYLIHAELGRGGMGVVYRAEQPELERQVAIKVIAPALATDQAFRDRFKRESRLAAAIEHPNAIPIYEAGATEDGTLFLAMRFVEGTDLSSLIAAEGRLRPRRAADLIEQVGGALDEAHAAGLVHRDVKPGNILVSRLREHDQAFLTDFGLTKKAAGTKSITAPGQWMGTVDYVAPEQVEGLPVDARADVYSLGCVLYHALTGAVPFPRESELAKLFAHANAPVPVPSERVPELPPQLDEVVARALVKDPPDRFASAGDLGRAAVAAAGGERATEPERSVAAGAAAPGGAGEPFGPGESVALPGARGGDAATQTVPAAGRRATARPGRRRLLAAGAGLLGVFVLAGVIALVAGVFDGGAESDPGVATAGDSGGTNGTGTAGEGGGTNGTGTAGDGGAFTTIDTGAYTVEVPMGWDFVKGPEKKSGDILGSVLSTKLTDPAGDIRLTINRRPNDPRTPSEQAGTARDEEAALPGYREIRFEGTDVDGRDTLLWQFEKDDIKQGLGEADATAYFLSLDGDAYRIQGNSRVGGDRARVGAEAARRAAQTLEPRGGG